MLDLGGSFTTVDVIIQIYSEIEMSDSVPYLWQSSERMNLLNTSETHVMFCEEGVVTIGFRKFKIWFEEDEDGFINGQWEEIPYVQI